MFGFNKQQPRKTGITYKYIISDVEMPEKVVAAPPEVTSATLLKIQQNHKAHRAEVKHQFSLNDLPNIQIKHLNPPTYVEEHDVDLIAEIVYTGIDNPPSQGMSWFTKLILAVLGSSFIGAIILFAVFSNQPESPECTITFVEGIPLKVRVDSTEYKLQPDGTMDLETRTFLNPWHAQTIDNGKCVRVDY